MSSQISTWVKEEKGRNRAKMLFQSLVPQNGRKAGSEPVGAEVSVKKCCPKLVRSCGDEMR